MSKITPVTPANIYDFNDKVISLPLIRLTVLVTGLKTRVKLGTDVFGVEVTCRKLLSAPEDYPVEYIYEHLALCLKNTKEFYGIKEEA
jgi:hypothetical protein